MLLEHILKVINQVITEVNENLPTLRVRIRTQWLFFFLIKYVKAWPGKVEIPYFLFTICGNIFPQREPALLLRQGGFPEGTHRVRAFDTSIADFRNLSVNEKQQNTVTIQKIRLPAGNY